MKREPRLPRSLSKVTLAFLERHSARFDPTARADEKTLRAFFAKSKLEPWPALLELERTFGGLRFGEDMGDWSLGVYAVAKKAPKVALKKTSPAELVCIGINDTGRLFADESGRIWDEDAAAGSVTARADSLERRLEREAHGMRIGALGQHAYKVLPTTVATAKGTKLLGLPLIEKASDEHERVWQSETITVWQSRDDVRVFAKSAALLEKAVAALS